MKILKFHATWCQPCKVLKTLMYGFEKCPVEEVDIERDTELVRKYNIKAVPTIVLVDESGEELWRKSGLTNVLELENAVHRYKRG